MNILHLSPYYAPAYAFGGVVRAVEGMATALAARGHGVTVLTTDALDPRHRATIGGDAREVDAVEYEPKMNVTPNAVALKDD